VATLDLTASPKAFDKDVFTKIRNNFIMKEQVDPNFPDLGIEVYLTQKEEAQIILDSSFSNKDYYAYGDLSGGQTRKPLLGCGVIEVAGNDSTAASVVVKEPMLEEDEELETRSCIALAPNAIALWEGGLTLDIFSEHEMRAQKYDASFGIFFGFDLIAERTLGDRCMVITTEL
jgi:hypothetical protein